ncbi:MAG: T9SS type A sorting domain-containing protein [Bacteroidia bacterium]
MKKILLCSLSSLLLCVITMGTTQAQDVRTKKFMQRLIEEKLHWPEGMKPTLPIEANKAKNTADERRLTTATSRTDSEAEAHIAVNPTDSLNIIMSYMQFGQAGLSFPIYVTFDGGDTWSQRSLDVEAIANLDTSLIYAGGGDPIFAFDATGKLYFSWLLLGLNVNQPTALGLRMFWVYSTDGGNTFQYLPNEGRIVAEGALDGFTNETLNIGVGAPDRQWMACDLTGGQYANTLYLASLFVRNDSGPAQANGMVVRYKRELDSTFQSVFVQVGDTGDFVSQLANIAVDSEGFVHVSYATIGDLGRYDGVWHAISRDGGQSFSAPVRVSVAADNDDAVLIHDRENMAPSLAVGPETGRVYMTWTTWDTVAATRLARGFFSISNDYGQTWSNPLDLNLLDGSGQLQHALYPVVGTNADGDVSIAWYSADLNSLSVYLMVTSDDGGVTFSNPVVISADTTDFTQYGDNQFFGDYNNIARVGCKSFVAWADGRDNLGAKMYIGRIDHCGPISGIEVTPIEAGWSISNPFPNPARASFSIELNNEKPGTWTAKLINAEGKVVKTYAPQTMTSGEHRLDFDLDAVAAGAYWMHISDGSVHATRMVVKR